MATATLNIELNDNIQYLSILGKEEQYKGSTAKMTKTTTGLTIVITAEDSKSLLSSIGSTVRKLRIVENTAEILPNLKNKKQN